MGEGSDQFVDVLLGYAVVIFADARVEGRGSQKSAPYFFEHVSGFLERSRRATSRLYRNHASPVPERNHLPLAGRQYRAMPDKCTNIDQEKQISAAC
jgi:hypothetical protein